jgi:hypothetical protein
MPAGRPRKPGGSTAAAPILSWRQTSEDEAALRIIKLERGQATVLDAARLAIRYEALRLAGQERLDRETAAVTRKRERA